jgi:hypothetical protein
MEIFKNRISKSAEEKALKQQIKLRRKFGDDSDKEFYYIVEENEILGPNIGVKNLELSGNPDGVDWSKALIIGNIRMGYGHYRISMAIASAANYLGYKPLWLDLHSYKQSAGGKIISHLNNLYSFGSRLSQKFRLFDKFYWEPLNSHGFKKLTYNASDMKMCELMTPLYKNIPKTIPVLATHVWPAQAAVLAKMERVINVIPDNWSLGLHLAEGSIHTVQTPSAYFSYKTLKGMDGKKIMNPIPENEIVFTGHYIDHELVVNIKDDCKRRIDRVSSGKPKRILLSVGGAGAQKEIFVRIIKGLLPKIADKEVLLLINVGDHIGLLNELVKEIPELASGSFFKNDWKGVTRFTDKLFKSSESGVYMFYDENIFSAVYATNLLMRHTDILITKPSELAFYPVPKLLIKRVGGHEAWGAIRAAEVGDGTIECETVDHSLQMLKLMLSEKTMLLMMNDCILKADKAEVYNGAYKAVKLAVEGMKKIPPKRVKK